MFKTIALLLLFTSAIYSLDYSVHFIGLDDPKTLKSVKAASFLTTLQKRPPASLNALRSRAESDIPDMIKALHARGYYEATIQLRIEEDEEGAQIFVLIQPGPVYLVHAINIEVVSGGQPLSCALLTPHTLGIEIDKPAITAQILDGEQKALALLGECGYPLATLEKQEMTADYKTKQFSIYFKIDAGPEVKFGPWSVRGDLITKTRFFANKIGWKEGEIYDARLVEKTQKKLLDTGLFSSVIIHHNPEPSPDSSLPMHLEVTETKYRSINFGASYQTYFGPGLTFGWENRNVMGMGRRLSLQGDVTAHSHTGTGTFFVPDCWKIDQDFVFQAQSMQESILAYRMMDYNLTSRVERRIGTKYRFSAGVRLERILVRDGVKKGTYSLCEIPLYFRWSSATDLLNPTRGATLEYKAIPTFNLNRTERLYLYNAVHYAFYFPIVGQDFLVLAQQVTFDSIVSRNLEAVSLPKRILGGSDTELRGYRYHSVSPLHHHKHPIGGRSGLFYSFEPRFRLSKSIGIVPFFDLGSVDLTPLPKWDKKWYTSVGVGLRYFTFLGPIRLDVAFPLDRRHEIDHFYRILVSIGQTF